ncbi:MAG: hypothetical protein GY953_45755 [bacterium]|nr:hypothetical protein [bacterium]
MSGAEIEQRLAQLRNHYHLSDEDVVQRATDRSLSGEPEFAECLVLLGKGDLIR